MRGNPRRDWTWALMVAVTTVVLSSIPYLIGYLTQTSESVFVGAVYDCQDYYSHLAKMQQGMRGEWRYQILFTPEQHQGAFINLFYLALGRLSGALSLPPTAVYHLARPLCAISLLLVAYGFIAHFVPDRETRKFAYLLACFSSGLGWLILLATGSFTLRGITPVDFWLIEMYTFFTVVTFPHTCLAQAVHLLAFLWMVQMLRGEATWRAWLAAVGAEGVLAIIHPYSLLPLQASLGLYWLYLQLRRSGDAGQRLLWLIGFGALPLPLVAYSYQAISSDPVLSAWQTQSYTLSPPPIHYLLGYGLILLLALWGSLRILREKRESAVPLMLWPLIVAPLLYTPLLFNLQRRMIEGIHVPLSILAAVGLKQGFLPALQRLPLATWVARLGYPRHRLGWLVGRGTLALTTPSTWYLLISLSMAAAGGVGDLHYSKSEVTAVAWLGDHTSPEETVLSSYAIGGYIPAWTGHRVFWGHWAESIHLHEKQRQVEGFYSDAETFERRTFLSRYGIEYVFHGPRERELGDFNPAAAPYLKLVFQAGEVMIYQVTAGESDQTGASEGPGGVVLSPQRGSIPSRPKPGQFANAGRVASLPHPGSGGQRVGRRRDLAALAPRRSATLGVCKKKAER